MFLAAGSVAFADTVPDGPGGPGIAVANTSTLVSSATLKRDLPYFQQYADQVCAAWHCSGHLYLGETQDSHDWQMTINDVSDVTGAIGYHMESAGVPQAFVSVKTAVQAHMHWTIVFTHELAEMLVDPPASLAANTACSTDGFGDAFSCRFFAFEVCDPVQGESFRIGPIYASDFVYRTWFMPDSLGPYDAGRHIGEPLSLAPRSYMSFYANDQWQSTDNFPAHDNWDSFGAARH